MTNRSYEVFFGDGVSVVAKSSLALFGNTPCVANRTATDHNSRGFCPSRSTANEQKPLENETAGDKDDKVSLTEIVPLR